eukprot:gene11968-12111_t
MGGSFSTHRFDGTGSRLLEAAQSGDATAVVELITRHPELLKYASHRRLSAAHFAACSQSAQVLQQLITKAHELQCIAVVKAHHKSKAPHLVRDLINAKSDRGVTPLMLAADKGCLATVKLLLDQGADAWAVDNLGGCTALHYAARRNRVEVLQLLIEAAGEQGELNFPNRPNTRYINVRTQWGLTAVHYAVHANAAEALAALINSGANILLSSLFDCMDSLSCARGSTPLHIAARNGNAAIAKQLLRAWVDSLQYRNLPDMRLVLDGNDRLACHVAAHRRHADLARLLLPSTPIAEVICDADMVLGPPSLARIAGLALHHVLLADLCTLQQATQAQDDVPPEPSACGHLWSGFRAIEQAALSATMKAVH